MSEVSALEAAVIACHHATDSRGLKIFLLSGTYGSDGGMLSGRRAIPSIEGVRQRMRDVARIFVDNHQFVTFGGEEIQTDPSGEETAARHLALLANVLAELLAEHRAVAA
jgi:hypothetical protein